MRKHTPGPWHIASDDSIDSDDRTVAQAYDNGDGMADGDDEIRANQTLIAAAPDLLDAALFAYGQVICEGKPGGPECSCGSCHARSELRHAIEKATIVHEEEPAF